MTAGSTVEVHHLLEGLEEAPVLVLSERFRLLRYDHRGHGGSPVPPGPYKIEDLGRDVLMLLGRLEVERFCICGLSIGGMVGMWLASEAPERVDHLVLCCTSARFAPDTFDSRVRTVRADGVGAIADAVVERWFTPAFRERRPEVAEWARRMLLGTPAEGYAGCCEAVRDADLGGGLGTISAPTLVIAGADDPAAPPDQAELISDSITGAALEVIPDGAHLANMEQPEAITQAILDYLSPVVREAR